MLFVNADDLGYWFDKFNYPTVLYCALLFYSINFFWWRSSYFGLWLAGTYPFYLYPKPLPIKKWF